MDKTKIDFIIDLLNDNRLEKSYKEKIFSLSHKELKKLEINDELILNRLDQLEKKLGRDSIADDKPITILSPDKTTPIISTSSLPKYYTNPKKTARFLDEFNKNIILKSTSHEIDENLHNSLLAELEIDEYSHSAHIAKIEAEFKRLTSLYSINIGLYGKISEYLLSIYKRGWSQDSIKVGWSSKEISDWCCDNPGKCPNPGSDLAYPACSLEDVIELKDGSYLKNFNDIISHFKSQIEFRDSTDLKKIVQKINILQFSDLKIDTDNLNEGIRFYSDVEKVSQAYKIIINMCLDHCRANGTLESNPPKFQLSLVEESDGDSSKIVFSIHHVNSIFGKSVNSLFDKYGNSFSGLVNNQLNGLCDFTLKAEFPNKQYSEVSIWPKNDKSTTLNHFNGVQFNLIFYRIS